MFSTKFYVTALILLVSATAMSESLVEREGRFEILWSSGKVVFYGTALPTAKSNQSWRTTEQLAWGNGLSYAESKLAGSLGRRSGLQTQKTPEKLSLLSSTSSLNTTYFGDGRIKVALESNLGAALGQMIDKSAGKVIPKSTDDVLLIKVSRPADPSAFLTVVDESGRELLAAADMAATFSTGRPVPKWFKTSAPDDAQNAAVGKSTIAATSPKRGVLKVATNDWKPEFAGMIANGKAILVVQ